MSTVQKAITKLTQIKLKPVRQQILPASEIQYAIQCERIRSDRREIPFSVIIVGTNSKDYLNSEAITKLIFDRLRMTDVVGRVDARHMAILLPDTESDSACKIAVELDDLLPNENGSPKIEVFTYPFDAEGIETDAEGEPLEKGMGDCKSSFRPQSLSFAVKLPVWKRALDILASLGILLLLSPFLLLTALLIKLTSKGPVFFTQWREGRNGQKFTIYKFRTMKANADALQDELRHLSEQNGPAFKIEKDPRLTWFGAILRKSCFDETPQFINILKGDMTLVGPRPLPVNESQACTRWQRRRLDVTPGMTCIWQVCGNRHVDFDEWMRMDQEYIRKSGLLTDIGILFKTALFVLLRRASV